MDPNFVQHEIGDAGTRLVGLLLFLAGISIYLFVALKVVYGTKGYQRLLGAEDSRFFPGTDPRPWISMLCGLVIAFGFQLHGVSYMLGISGDFFAAAQQAGALPFGLSTLAWHLDSAITGIALGGGPKVFVEMGKTWARVREQILQGGKSHA